MRNAALLAIPLAVIFSSLSLLHAYWAMGGRWGTGYTVPTVHGQRSFDPGSGATWVVCGLLALAALIVMGKATWTGTDLVAAMLNIGVWGIAVVFLLRAFGNWRTFGFFKKVTGSPFARWDTWLYTPLCVLIALLAAGLARMPRRP